MKTVYFVRHGESKSNISNIWLCDNTGLTNKGMKQAEYIASRCKKLSIDVIISSTLQRAKETSEIINSKIHKPLEFSNLFEERRWPSEQLGLRKDGIKSNKIKKIIWGNFSSSKFRYSDEENFYDLKKRIKIALLFLENRPEKNILVVTHGFILRIILSYIVMGKNLTGIQCDQFIDKFHTKNTGFTVVHYGKTDKRTKWHISVWNDHSHLT